MKALLGIALAAAITYAVLKSARSNARTLPTLQPVQDADPLRPEPLSNGDLKVAQNAPF
jgi:hypothetical protein